MANCFSSDEICLVSSDTLNSKSLPAKYYGKYFPYVFSLLNYSVIKENMKEIMLLCFNASKSKLVQRSSMFELLGFDFMIDSDMKVSTVKVMTNNTCFIIDINFTKNNLVSLISYRNFA